MSEKIVATNKAARRDYHILETYEAGIELKGTEVKSLRGAKANLKDAFARIDKGEVFLYNMHISPYAFGNIANVDAKRQRRLLLHKSQIRKLFDKTRQKGFTLVPLKAYFKEGRVKIELALAKGKHLYDKRESIKRREADRETKRALRSKNR
ncbi:MAG: SsrA-binding protein SmpB [Candidatus Omnitrophota bacterium]|nr:MAG: SsrA-binding protein SmpB [Candidatus Omnitrophota bacterium]